MRYPHDSVDQRDLALQRERILREHLRQVEETAIQGIRATGAERNTALLEVQRVAQKGLREAA